MADKSEDKTVTAFKGFDKDLKCRGFQFEVGKTYEHEGKIEICSSGFHSCENPLDVFSYYPPTSRFCTVKVSGKTVRHDGDSKIAAARISIEAELNLGKLTKHAIGFIMSKVKPSDGIHNTGYQSAASNTGDYSAASNTGGNSIAMASGIGAKAKASEGSAIVLCSYDKERNLKHIKSALAGKKYTWGRIKPDTWYTLTGKGRFKEA